MSWFEEIDHQVGMVFGGDRNNPMAWPRRQHQVLGRVLGMLVGGALGSTVGAVQERLGEHDALIRALRRQRWAGPNTDVVIGVVETATRALADHRSGADLDSALHARFRELTPVSQLGCFAGSASAALVSITDADADAFRRAAGLAASLGESPEAQAGAGVLAVALVRGLNGHVLDVDRLVEILVEHVSPEHSELRGKLEIVASAGEREVLGELGRGDSESEVVARALFLGARKAGGRAEVVHASAGGNPSRNAQVSGLLTGARRGAEGFPLVWRRKLETEARLELAAMRFASELGPDQVYLSTPKIPGEPRPVEELTATPPIDAHERFLGSMLAGAVGDGLGFAVEFKDIHVIRREFGLGGVSGPVLRGGVARVSDDTQMMLFTLEGLIRAHVARRRTPSDNDPVPEVQHAYQRWYHTQGRDWLSAAGPYAQHLRRPDGWLITNRELFDTRAPGRTCLTALSNFAQTGVFATPRHRINDSKGCGGVMRAAPVAVWSNDPSEVFHAAVGTAALTHSHPSGFLSAGVLAVIVHQLIRDVPLREAVALARELLTRWPEHEEQLRALDKAVALAERGPVSPEEIAQELGGGWVGEEALAIGLYAVLATDDLREALLLSVNHSGDSDSTGMVCGNIGGALHGARAVPAEWLETLELRGLVETVARDALAEFSPGPPSDPGWAQRYPAW
ncbi:ADP-ribosylglycohydrolase family protein [Saccharopolyspora flava]|nr:ADP-ribosylglycohydrolase family protein [Saccharopolyspora flava]